MASPAPGSVLLFLGSDPALADRLAARPATLAWMARFFVPPSVVLARAARATGAPGDEPGPFPPDQVLCAQRVLDRAKKLRRTVQLVDVNRPGEARALVQRFVAATDVLPILVRPDGARLIGTESFDPRSIREFLAGG
jgi:hypothetical protein